MTKCQPHITRTIHILPFDRLGPADFERLCLHLVKNEGYEHVEHLGAAGKEQGRDIVAWKEGRLWAFQCKRVQRFGPKAATEEVEKVLALPEDERPAGLLFLVTCKVSDGTRKEARRQCQDKMECHFWAHTELDLKVCQHPDIVAKFFGLPSTVAALRALFPEGEPAFEQLMESMHELIRRYEVLREWKELHHLLQGCLAALRPFMSEVEIAYNSDYAWEPKRGKRWWNPFRTKLGELKLFAERVHYIGNLPLYEDESVLRGEPWVVEIVHTGYDVEEFLDGHDIEELYEYTLHLSEACDKHLSFADTRLREVAAGLSTLLHGTLREIGQ